MYEDFHAIRTLVERVKRWSENANDGLRCEKCRSIDFSGLLHVRDGPNHRLTDVSYIVLDHDCGSVEEIRQRRSRCKLCAFVMILLERDKSGSPIPPHYRVHLNSWPYFSANFTDGVEGQREIVLHLSKLLVSTEPPSKTALRDLSEPYGPSFWLQIFDLPLPMITESVGEEDFGFRPAALTRITGRQMPRQVDLRLLKGWVRLCEKDHLHSCGNHNLKRRLNPLQSLRVIDVKSRCIVNSPDNCRYVALTYVWGTTNTLLLTSANLTAMQTAGFLEEHKPPATIRDAMQVVEGSGERFLWVDSLCIIQDDDSDLTLQMAQMGVVFATALFTIFATTGKHADAGLPGIQSGTRDIEQDQIELDGFGLMKLVDNVYSDEVKYSKWSQRAWTMQEEVFSQRRVYFTSKQMHWVCANANWLEQTSRETSLLGNLLCSDREFGVLDALEPSFNDADVFQHIVLNYTPRQLTKEADTLNAISGISSALTSITGHLYLWGLPASEISQALAWRFQKKTKVNHSTIFVEANEYHRNRSLHPVRLSSGKVLHVPFPTWSWSGWKMGYSARWRLHSQAEVAPNSGIIFYHYAENGTFRRVCDRKPNLVADMYTNPTSAHQLTIHNEFPDSQKQWMGSPNAVGERAPLTDEQLEVDNACLTQLVFWTSCATVRIYIQNLVPYGYFSDEGVIEPHPTGQILHKGVYYDSDVEDNISNQHGQEAREETENPAPPSLPISANTSDEVIRDIIIVGRSTDLKDLLNALIIRWRNGMAYRVGHTFVSEENWIRCERTWRLVTMV